MNEIKRSEIIYEEGWRENTSDFSADSGTPEDELPPMSEPESEKESKLLLVTVQLIICIILALAVLLLKVTNSALYRGFMDYFNDELKKPVISQGVFSTIDESLFKNQAHASYDEAAPGQD